MHIEPIGTVRSPIDQLVDEDWGSVVSEIELKDEYAPALRGLDEFSHIVVVFYMHLATFNPYMDLQRRPRGLEYLPELGIFAQRAKHRPNPIGITTVSLLDIREHVLTVRGLDAVDGTPVLDIKPYMPDFDRADDVRTPEWVAKVMQGYF